MKKRGLAIAVVSAMLVATLGACGSGFGFQAGGKYRKERGR